MARMKKAEVIERLTVLGVAFKPGDPYNSLCDLLKRHSDPNEDGDRTDPAIPNGSVKPKQIKMVNRIKKRNTFLADAVRDERDAAFINDELRKREYKGRVVRKTTIKEYVVSADGFWKTSFIIDLKE